MTGWFPPQRRGVAMGIRQTAQPLGIALGAAVIPELAEHGFAAAMMFPAVICMLSGVACALGVLDPPRKPRATATIAELASPYRGSSVLWRIHMVSALLMIPQTVTVTFMLIWLLNEYHWSVGRRARWSLPRSYSARWAAFWSGDGLTGSGHGCGPCVRSRPPRLRP
ncbi:major Facilitator Superfamily protein [Mycobacterium xenopi 4042]|uniref:Major Facilitator Superfamily protein n=1 Tax=Mycobacterium xenopi 4042 TaxID=1299334 RepID=X7Z5J9_MYCXE|nr:major Facilitator Superfamily protein [Mycobacterium xenopi 4042]EUA34005.1 major Facilitator Superfamily protein [Mycobacterium xenopi 3993]